MNSNTLEFYVKMRDLMSSGLARLARTGQDTFNRIQRAMNNVENRNRQVGNSFDNVTSRIRNTRNEVDRLNNSANNASRFLGKAAGFLGMGLSLGAVAGFAKSSVSSAMNFGATQKSFEVLTGSRSKGIGLANNLNTLQQNTILGPEVFQAAQTMMGFGVAGEKVVKIEKQIGDVAMGNKQKFEGLTLAFSQTQAAGRLMGQDLLQYVNAGFNPLKVMSEHWQEFGLKQKMTVGELKQQMEKGAISAQAVAKAFEVATSKGGQFNGMMDAIAQTSFGKMQILEGQWENLKISAGNALMPIAESLMDAASKTMDWLNITKSAPAALMSEKAEIDTLVGSITSLNQGNELRHQLIQQLITKYPDLFGKLDAEKVKNSELLTTLQQINAAYKDKIALASSDLMMDTNKKIAGSAQSEWVRNNAIVMALQQGDTQTAKSLMTATESAAFGLGNFFGKKSNQSQMFYSQANDAKARMDAANGVIAKNETANRNMHTMADLTSTFASAYGLAHDKDALNNLFGKDGKSKDAFLKLAGQLSYSNGVYHSNGGGLAYAAQLNKYMTPSSAGAGGNQPLIGGGKTKADGDGIGRSVTSGGPRVININGVKFADKIEIHGESMGNAYDKTEKRLEEMYLRVLNSGASVQ